jgi:hypothetical protein
VLKLALSLAVLLTLASPSFAKKSDPSPDPKKVECIAPDKFGKDVTRIEGDDLVKFREIANGLTERADLVILLKIAPVAVVFSKGCAIGVGHLRAPASAPGPLDDGKI